MSAHDASQEERIDWPTALELLASSRMVLASQTHDRQVRLTDEEGHSYVTEEPEIDDVLRAINDLPAETRDKIALLSE